MTEQEFHKRSIKGINLSIILSTAGILISGAWFGAMAYSNLQQSLIDLKTQGLSNLQESKQFTKDQVNGLRNEMNAKFDTVKMDQLRNHYETSRQLGELKSTKHVSAGLFTEKRTSSGIAFVPFKP